MLLLAIAGWLAAVVGGVGGVVVRVLSPAPILPTTFGLGDAAIAAFAIQGITFASVGALLVQRRPDNAVGRVLIITGASYALSMLTGAVTFAAAAASPTGQTAAVAGWLTVVLSSIGSGALAYLALIFPTGRAHSPRWERFRRLALGLGAVAALLLFAQPGPLQLLPDIDNPFGIGPDARLLFGERAMPALTASGGVVVGLIAIVAVVSRYRQAGRLERQQLKWFISAALASLLSLVLTTSAAIERDGSRGELPLVVYGLTGAAVPVAIGIAILRHRLYDIDRLIGRTLAYGAVTAVLAGTYAVAVLTLGALLGAFAQGGTLAAAASTLLVFALFGPVRRRAQAVVDRRFDRSRLDAAETVQALTERLRNEVHADRIEGDILGVVGRTFRPVHAGIWLRASNDRGIHTRRPSTGIAR